jgi:glycosyltransferase involved in cell wall biosynthesis
MTEMFARPASPAPLVSVVIPAYNCAALVLQAVESVLTQDYEPLEVIVVDDGSTDGTHEALRPVLERIRLIRQPNGGLAAARNRGHREARGEYIAWLDSDDICEPGRIALQVEVLRRFPEVVLVSTGFSAFNDDAIVSSSFAAEYYGAIATDGLAGLYPQQVDFVPAGARPGDHPIALHRGTVYPRIVWGNFVHPPTTMMRRAAVEIIEPLDSRLAGAGDWEFFTRLSRQGQFAHLDKPLLRYRLSSSQMSGPRNALRNVVGEIRVLDQSLAADPSLRTERAQIRRLSRAWLLILACAHAQANRRLALVHLARSMRHGIDPVPFARATVHVATPTGLLLASRRTAAAGAGVYPALVRALGSGSDSVALLLSGLEPAFVDAMTTLSMFAAW